MKWQVYGGDDWTPQGPIADSKEEAQQAFVKREEDRGVEGRPWAWWRKQGMRTRKVKKTEPLDVR